MTSRAREAYCDESRCSRKALQDSPGPICLHACFGYTLTDLTVPALTRSPRGVLVATIEGMFRRRNGKIWDENESLTLHVHHRRINIALATSYG